MEKKENTSKSDKSTKKPVKSTKGKGKSAGKGKKTDKVIIAYANELNDFPLPKSSIKQYDLLWVIIGKVRNQGTNEVVLSGKELRKLVNFKGTKAKFNELIIRLTTSLQATLLRKDTADKFHQVVLFPEAIYDKRSEQLTLKTSPDSAKFFNNLSGSFTMWYQQTLLDLDTVYAKTLFRKLSQWSNTGRYMAKFEDFRYVMGIPKTYRNKELRAKIIQPSLIRLMPFFKNLRYEITKTGDNHAFANIVFNFDKFESKDALDKGPDKEQCISNIRLNPYFTDEEKWEAEDIFLGSKKGTAEKAAKAREAAGLGPLDDVIEPEDRKEAGKKVEAEVADTEKASTTEEAPESTNQGNATSLDIKSFKINTGKKSTSSASQEVSSGISSEILKHIDKYLKPTIPQTISIFTGNIKGIESDPYVRVWLEKNFEKPSLRYSSLEKKMETLNALALPESKKQIVAVDLVLGPDWKKAEENTIPFDPVLRDIWGDLNSRDALLLADVYKNLQNKLGYRLNAQQTRDEALLRGLAAALTEDREYMHQKYDDSTLDVLAALRGWDQLREWSPALGASQNMIVMTLNGMGISVQDWLDGKPNLDF